MKRKDKEQLRTKTRKELIAQLEEKRAALVKAKMEKGQGKLKDIKKTMRLRKEIALIKTIIREKELMGEENEKEKQE